MRKKIILRQQIQYVQLKFKSNINQTKKNYHLQPKTRIIISNQNTNLREKTLNPNLIPLMTNMQDRIFLLIKRQILISYQNPKNPDLNFLLELKITGKSRKKFPKSTRKASKQNISIPTFSIS